ncbi:Nitrogen assimilation transcription factor [Penicillium ucsense]|uniref:Nitrogen assimilation transcription factor n=1 Tax=Penicillium ucsense TaxID=2839758 RepID=A0A8J8VZL2_9EURO|nr:Nitrogen assimilation transcription factor [Penicillium ucsense]KAF7733285.1 Nitrogen assimilation transcription factor [Penicillium ucsense]
MADDQNMSDVPLKSALPRKSAFSCEACRKRKVKCNGASPACSRCAARGETCIYSLAPTLSYTKQLEARVAQLEDALSKARGEPADTDVPKASSPLSLAESSSSAGYKVRSAGDDSRELARDFEGLSIETDGRISFHGPTSLFQLPSGLLSETKPTALVVHELQARKERLVHSAWRERAFEQMASIPEPFQYLLDSHWCWIQPLFNFIYRPAFTRDMKIQGPYYSDALMNAILSHSVRWCKAEPQIGPLLDSYEGGALFSRRAVSGLFEIVQSGQASVPTVQTLLLLSAQECGKGNRTQAWLYSGMAFRMLEDLGISIDSRKYLGAAQLSDEDIEIRNRLFWSCYFWDKVISLYFGRAPAMQHSQVSPPRLILDDTSEVESWGPHGVTFPDGAHYPPTQAHSTSCFIQMCGLAEVLNQILIHIYDPMRQGTEAEFFDCVGEQAKNLSDWWDELPTYLKLGAADLPPYSPPSHIMTLNCFYHTVNILLHRPVLCSRALLKTRPESYDKSHLVQCLASATSILSLFDLYRRTFGDNHVVLSLAYSIYTAASIFLLEIQALKYAAPGTLDKLNFCIATLERIKISNPVITTALGLIYQEARKLQIDMHLVLPHRHTHSDSQHPSSSGPVHTHSQSYSQPQSSHPSHRSHSTPTSSNHSRHVSPALQQQQSQHQHHHQQQQQQQQQQQHQTHHQQHQRPQSRTAMTSHSVSSDPSANASMIPEYHAFSSPGGAFGQSHIGEMPQMVPTHLLGGMPNALMTVDNQSGYEITPEVFEAFSYAQPMSTTMATPFQGEWTGPPH